MGKVIVAVRDLKASAFVYPQFAVSAGVAIRSFGDAVADSQSALHAHAADYQLFKLGDLDDVTGLITPVLVPELLAYAVDFVKVGNNE